MRSQCLSLTRLTGKTYGPRFAQARQLYLQVIRSSLAYGCTSTHQPTSCEANAKPRGLAKSLQKYENTALRTVTGGFRATPIRCLHTESGIPPLDLHFNYARLRFEEKIESSPLQVPLQQAFAKIRQRFAPAMRRGGSRRAVSPPRKSKRSDTARNTLMEWKGPAVSAKEALFMRWKERFMREQKGVSLADTRAVELFSFSNPERSFQKDRRSHKGLSKAESSCLVQARTGKIGFRAFLFGMKVPSVVTPFCLCGIAEETVGHVLEGCPARQGAPGEQGRVEILMNGLYTGKNTKASLRWLMNELPMYKVALEGGEE